METALDAPPATEAMARDLAVLRANADRWARLPVAEKVRYLDAILQRTESVAEGQVRAAHAAKGIAPGSPWEAEDWLGGPVIQARVVRLMRRTLTQIAATGKPTLPDGAVRTRPNGRLAVDVFPETPLDRVSLPGFRAEVWLQEGVSRDNVAAHQAAFYAQSQPKGAVTLVLGAGNVASIGPLDMVDALFVDGQVCLLKFNPVNAYLGPFVEEAFADLIRDGFVRTAYGGADVGAWLCGHPEVDRIHITGSDKTHDAIVFGGGAEGAKRKRQNRPRLKKKVTSELGNVSPVIIVPGPWTTSDLRFHAENVATQMTNNGGFNCNACKVIVLSEAWPQKRLFLDLLRGVLARVPQRRAYYPGAEGRYDRFVGLHPEAEPIGPRTPGVLPWTLVPGLDAGAEDEACFTEESFCGITAQTALPGDTPRDFLANAVDFCNDKLWGTLNACVIVHPRTREALGPAFHQALEDLRYGSVGVNHWPAMSYALGVTSWGAWPGHTLTDIQSGIGVVHNAFMFDKVEKSIIEGPFRVRPRPPWFVTHRNAVGVAKRLLAFELEPSYLRLPGLIWQALRG